VSNWFCTAGLPTESNSLFAIVKEKHLTHIQLHRNSITMNLGIFGIKSKEGKVTPLQAWCGPEGG
jgi:hypothetical protein